MSTERLSLSIAGVRIDLRLVPALARRVDEAFALGALATGGEPVEIFGWDSASTGQPPPTSPWSKGDFLPRDGLRGSGRDGFDFAYDVRWRLLSVWDRNGRVGGFWAGDAAHLPYWEPTAPFRYLINWVLADRGVVLAHAAAVGTSEGGLLVVGPGGSGKSTTALIALASGWSYVADDYCALTTGPTPSAHALYAAAKLDAGSLSLLPALATETEEGVEGSPKRLLFPDRAAPAQAVAQLPIRAVVVPRVAASTGHPERIPIATAARALAASTLYQMAGTRPETFQMIGRALRGLPAFSLEVGPDVERVPDRLEECLA